MDRWQKAKWKLDGTIGKNMYEGKKKESVKEKSVKTRKQSIKPANKKSS